MTTKTKSINLILLSLTILNFMYVIFCLGFPETWFKIFHGVPYVDPQGFLQRTAAVWAAFSLFEFIGYLNWQKRRYWLAVVAGMRMSELFADWTFLCVAENLTVMGKWSFFLSAPANALVCWLLLKSYLKPEEKI